MIPDESMLATMTITLPYCLSSLALNIYILDDQSGILGYRQSTTTWRFDFCNSRSELRQ